MRRHKASVNVTLEVGGRRVFTWHGRMTGSKALPKAMEKAMPPEDAEPNWAGLTKRRK